jgi:hypothetical protein
LSIERSANLCIGQRQRLSDFVSVSRREVFLVEESFLELVDLVVRECCAQLAILGADSAAASGVMQRVTAATAHIASRRPV